MEIFGKSLTNSFSQNDSNNEKYINFMKIDILYVNYNSSKILLDSISSVLDTKDDYGKLIYVWDNNSDDNFRQIKSEFPSIYQYNSKTNVGFAKGINQLLKKSNSPYVVFVNPDTIIPKTFFINLIDFLNNNSEIGVVGPKILNPDGTLQGSARRFPNPMTSLFGRNSPLTKLFPNNSITAKNIITTKAEINKPTEVDWVSGACMVMRRDVIEAVGGFDERFFLYWEDADLCRRIRRKGHKIIYYPYCEIIHCVGESSNTRPVFANYQFHKSCYRLYDKYIDWPFSILTPIAGIALMLRFLLAVLFNWFGSIFYRVRSTLKDDDIKNDQQLKKVKILRIISRMNIGGPSIHVKNLTEILDKNKYETKLITGTISPDEGDMSYIAKFNQKQKISIPELQREISLLKDIIALFKVICYINNFKPNIIHSHTSKAGTLSRLAALFYNTYLPNKIITIHTFHGNVLYGYFSRLKTFFILNVEKFLSIFTDRIIAISESQKIELSEVYRICDKNKIKTVKLGFELDPFINCKKRSGQLRKKMSLSKDVFLVGIVGRMAPIKNHVMFLDAAKLVIERCLDKKIKFILVGDGELRNSLERYVEDNGLNEHIIFHGWEKDIPMVYADLDILALTSLNEGTPVSIIEAMAAKVPVLTTGVGGVTDLLGEVEFPQPEQALFKVCERGILCPKDDHHAFSNALSYMMESEYLSDQKRFRKAQEFVIENYSVKRLINDIDELYDEVLRHASA